MSPPALSSCKQVLWLWPVGRGVEQMGRSRCGACGPAAMMLTSSPVSGSVAAGDQPRGDHQGRGRRERGQAEAASKIVKQAGEARTDHLPEAKGCGHEG